MNLTPKDKEDLKALTRHPGFKVLEKIEKELLDEYLKAYRNIDFSNTGAIEELKKAQIYVQAREGFLLNTEKHIQDSYIPTMSDFFKKPGQEIEED